MRILITGKNGQVGFELERRLADGFSVTAVDMGELDLTREDDIDRVCREVKPQLVINAAAYTAVDRAEDEADTSYAVNAQAPALFAKYLKANNGTLIHYSTDYVYDGSKQTPYTESDATNPLGVYGASKLKGDELVLQSGCPAMIFRTSWVYGPRGANFFLTMLRLLQEKESLNIVHDQHGAPTSALAIADATVRCIETVWSEQRLTVQQASGLYHMTCAGQTTWHDFTLAIKRLMGNHKSFNSGNLATISPITTDQYPTKARRPLYSVLDNGRLAEVFDVRLPDWETALAQVFSRYLQTSRATGA